jgi:hypothetical protein
VPCQHHAAHAIQRCRRTGRSGICADAPDSYPRPTRAGVARPFSLAAERFGGFYAVNGGTSPAHKQREDYTNF